MNELNTTSKLYRFDERNENLSLKILEEIKDARAKGIKYFVIGDISDKTTGFQRGSIMSNVITNLKKLKEQTDVVLVIKNTFEDINFYKIILNKVPGVKFQFDEDFALKYSSNDLSEWKEFLNVCEVFQ